MNRFWVFLLMVFCCAVSVSAQDTFYVKKKPAVAVVTPRAANDSSNHDSIVSYTIEYQKPGSNLFVVLHKQGGKYFDIPWEATQNGNRVLVKDIIRMDDKGKKYRQPDMYYAGGYWVPVKANK